MSGIKQPILDVLNRLKLIQVTNRDGNTVPLYVRKFNNQIEREKDGSIPPYQRPAAFVEVLRGVQFEQKGLGIRDADIGFKIHLVNDFYNDENGENFDADLEIYDLRDKILAPDYGLSQFCPTACGTMNCVSEGEEQDHDNVNVYILEFVCNFTDSKGSKYDDGQAFKEETNPDLDLIVVEGGISTSTIEDTPYLIP